MSWSAFDHACMARALRLAERGLATTQPNPRVGCVIARSGTVIGVGWHQRAGGPHAEVFALREAGGAARGATVYTTLEPCGRVGRTPACADALIAAGVARVVMAGEDANQRGAGAVERMRAAGIEVEVGLLRAASRELNRGFFSRIERGRPWLRLKLATSLDGRSALADGRSKWISGEAARADVQRWRARSSALLTGIGTVLADDPALTVRDFELDAAPSPPLRVVLDSRLRTPPGAQVLDGAAPTLLLHGREVRPGAKFRGAECRALENGPGGLDLQAVLGELARRGVNELQAEAGATLCGALLAAGLVDELLLYVAPILLGSAARPLLQLPPLADMTERWCLERNDERRVGDDWRLLLRPRA